MESIGQRIRDLRKAKGISIKDMADKVAMSYTGYQRIEMTGNTTVATLSKLAEALEVSFGELLGLEGGNMTNADQGRVRELEMENLKLKLSNKEKDEDLQVNKLITSIFLLSLEIDDVLSFYNAYNEVQEFRDVVSYDQIEKAYIKMIAVINDRIESLSKIELGKEFAEYFKASLDYKLSKPLDPLSEHTRYDTKQQFFFVHKERRWINAINHGLAIVLSSVKNS